MATTISTRRISRSQERPRLWGLPLATCLMLVASMCGRAMADPIMGTITVTVTNPSSPNGTSSPQYPFSDLSAQSVDSTGRPGAIDLSTLPTNLPVPGTNLGPNTFGNYTEKINAPFDLRITFNGASGSHPSVELTGTLVGAIGGTTQYYNMGGFFSPTLTSAALHDWTPATGIPLSLINQYMNPASYHLDGAIEGGALNGVGYLTTVSPSTGGAPIPEPSSAIIFLALIGGGLACGLARKRCGSVRGEACAP